MRPKKNNTTETVIETEPAVVEPVMVAPAPAPTAIVTDPVQEAMDARDALMRRHEVVTDEIAAVKAEVDQIDAAASELLAADQLDESAYEANRVHFAEVVKHLDMLRARADALWQRGIEVEQVRTLAIAKRNASQRKEEIVQYQREVEENEQQLLSDMRRLFAMAEGRVGGDLSWLSGGSEMLRYYVRLGELSGWALSLGVGEPYRFGTDLFNSMLRVGMADPRTP